MITPNLEIAKPSKFELVEIGYDVAGKYYTLRKTESQVKEGVYIEASKVMMLTIEQAEKLKNDLNSLFGYHNKA